MVYKFFLLSDEVDHFKREILIDSESTFLDLHNIILESVNYSKDQLSSFFLCEDDWSKTNEITLVDMDTSFEEDNYTMADTVLSEFLEDEKQKLLFVYDYIYERAFFMELSEIITGKTLSAPVCSKSVGEAPPQQIEPDELESTVSSSLNLDEDFFGQDSFDIDELDKEGFEGLDGLEDMASNPYDD